ncbi:MAG: sodium:proton antiporter [Planctomycetes bacterium]|nr:sodium:proton antiporter [Planctomycetota bacterium]
MPSPSSLAIPNPAWTAPFAALLLAIAILPLIPKTAHWWHQNRNKLLVALVLGFITLLHYHFRGFGFTHDQHTSEPGLATTLAVLHATILREFFPFMSLLFSLYVIAGGIRVRGDIPAHPLTNTTILGIGGVMASIVGTTGASMLLIRPLLATNSERKRVVHTVVFFIFIVSNIGGSLLPIGDPPLLLGYLRGVPFLWTLTLWKEWAFCTGILLALYYVWDKFEYKKETPRRIALDETRVEPIRIDGGKNVLWLLLVILVTGTISPIKPFLNTNWTPPFYLREALQLAFVGVSLLTTPKNLRKETNFSYDAIVEVACLFAGIFLCMQVPMEILNAKGASLGVDTPAKFFWATGMLSSFLDNAPTYLVFFETANAMTHSAGPGILQLVSGHYIREDLLVAISIGAVFMGANTYIGNGPNFMVKSIAESAGVKMPSFFGYMAYSVCILIPLFGLVTFVFLR